MRRPRRVDGYAPIRDYAVIGNKRTAALVALDGSIDWMCLPGFDSGAVFGALLDARSGGRYMLAPECPYSAQRRYVEHTNVLETTYSTADGTVRVTEALNLREIGPLPWNELVRRVEGLSGRVPMRWSLAPRFEWGATGGALEWRDGVPIIVAGRHALALQAFDAGEPEGAFGPGGAQVSGSVAIREGETALLALSCFYDEPHLFSSRSDLEGRIAQTVDFWRRWAEMARYDGPWREAVVRSALALELLVYAPTGAMIAAPTSSLPEAIGGSRNWDYRYSWVRDTAFTLEAMLRIGYRDQVHSSLAWLLQTIKRTHPRLSVFYHLNGEPPGETVELDLEGYRRSRPVRYGNGAAAQLQLGNWGDLLQTAWLYVEDGNALDHDSGRRLAELADFVCEIWRDPDASIWELGQTHQYTQGKLSCWLALDRAASLAERGQVPDGRVDRWRETAGVIRDYMETRCWSKEQSSYNRYADSDELDASVLLAARVGYADPRGERMQATVDALRRELGRGPLLYRYSGMSEQEGAFLACSFWLVEVLARGGRLEEAAETMDELVELGNDVGLYSEEIDPDSMEFLGNFPQALTHLGLINAASAFGRASEEEGS